MMIRLPELEEQVVRRDVLSTQEEGVLAALRMALMEIRGGLPVPEPLQADNAARLAGAKPNGGAEISGVRLYKVGNVVFSLQLISGPGERIEICFIADNQ